MPLHITSIGEWVAGSNTQPSDLIERNQASVARIERSEIRDELFNNKIASCVDRPDQCAGKTVTWTSYNYPKSVTANGRTVTFEYGPNRERIREEGGEYTTTFVGAHFESTWDDGGRIDRHYIRVGSQVVAIHVRKPDYHHNTYYLHRDHIGSVSVITDRDSNVLARMSFDAFGQRRVAETWEEGFPISTELDKIRKVTTRGYTGHQMVDDVNLIHMGGRIYDPELGRFLSPDPFVAEPGNAQGFNRYAYVNNNPLSFTDPSGFITMALNSRSTGSGVIEPDADCQTLWNCLTPEQQAEIQAAFSNSGNVIVYINSDGTVSWEIKVPSEVTSTANGVGGFLGGLADQIIHNFAQAGLNAPLGSTPEFGLGHMSFSDLGFELEPLPPASSPEEQLGRNLSPLTGIFGALFLRSPAGIERTAGTLGRQGEAAVRNVYDIGRKEKVLVHGRRRVPDGINANARTISEVKNVRSLSLTGQLRDYRDYAAANGYRFDLYTRGDTRLSAPLQSLIDRGVINQRYIP